MADTYLEVINSPYDNGVEKNSEYSGEYLQPTQHPPGSDSLSDEGYNASQTSDYEKLRPGDSVYSGSAYSSDNSGYSQSTTVTCLSSTSANYLDPPPPSYFPIPDRTTVHPPRIPANEKIPPRIKEYKEHPDRCCCRCSRTTLVIAILATLIVLGALGGVAYGIYYGVTKNQDNTQSVLVFGEMNYTDSSKLDKSFQDSFPARMDAILTSDSYVHHIFQNSHLLGISERDKSLKFILNFLPEATKNNHGGLFGAIKNLIKDAFSSDGLTFKCLAILPEIVSDTYANYNCAFNQTDFSSYYNRK